MSNNQVTIERSLPALQKCISVGEGWDDVIAEHEWLRFLVRMLLTPLVLAPITRRSSATTAGA